LFSNRAIAVGGGQVIELKLDSVGNLRAQGNADGNVTVCKLKRGQERLTQAGLGDGKRF
jgi:hypothetical protein